VGRGVPGSRRWRSAAGAAATLPLTVRSEAVVSYERVPGSPFGVAGKPDGRFAFVDLVAGRSDPRGLRTAAGQAFINPQAESPC
jgi:hypothetical protein